MRKMMLAGVLGLLGSYAALCALVAWKQTSLMLFPSREMSGNPRDLGLDYAEWSLPSSDGALLHGWQIPPPPGVQRGWVLHCHGNGGNISDRLSLAQELHGLGLGVVLFDYRGFGQSQGQIATQAQLLADGQAAYDRLAELGQPILLYGESLGGAVASYLAQTNPCEALVLQSTFTSLADRGSEAYPWLPIRWLSRFPLPVAERLASLQCPVLVMHGPQDEVIGFHHGQQLFARARPPKGWAELRGGHNSTDMAHLAQSLDHWLERNDLLKSP
jgi:alpha-beta hydrolase superfamily lysophospholipase